MFRCFVDVMQFINGQIVENNTFAKKLFKFFSCQAVKFISRKLCKTYIHFPSYTNYYVR